LFHIKSLAARSAILIFDRSSCAPGLRQPIQEDAQQERPWTVTSPSPAEVSTATAVVETLKDAGVTTVFALPGVQNDFLFDALHHASNAIRVIHTRHEQGAAYMALGAAMATGKPAVYAVVPGPGVLNTTAALSTAYACNAPVVCITGQIASAAIGKGLGHLHELPDQLSTLRSLTKWAARIETPAQAPALTQTALREAVSGRPRPVALECAIDVWPQKGLVDLGAGEISADAEKIDERQIDQACALLRQAKKPMIVIGGGAQHASREIKALAERLNAPVVANRMGLGVLDSRHPLAFNFLGGVFLWDETDVVIAIGTRMMMQAEFGLAGKKVIRIDIDEDQIGKLVAADVAIKGDAAQIVRALNDTLGNARATGWDAATFDKVRQKIARQCAMLGPQAAYTAAIRAALPEHGIFVDEVTQMGHVSRLLFPVYRPRTYLTPAYQGTLGWGYATALGAQAACPDTPVISISGDGGFMFNVQELATAAHHRLPVVSIVFNDNAFGNVRRIQEQRFGNRLIASDLTNPDFVALGKSFGIASSRVTSPEELRRALDNALAQRTPHLIEVPIGPLPDPWPILKATPAS
jgi:acetolactate synthase-1/2/3 large subunit